MKEVGKKFKNIVNSKLFIGTMIFIVLSLASVFAGNVVVKDGTLSADNLLDSNEIVYSDGTKLTSSSDFYWNGNLLSITSTITGDGTGLRIQNGAGNGFIIYPNDTGANSKTIIHTNANEDLDFQIGGSSSSLFIDGTAVDVPGAFTAGTILSDGAGSFGGALDMNSHQINEVTDPTSDQDAATKKYVDDNIAIPTGTYYYSVNPNQWKPKYTDTDDIYYTTTKVQASADNIFLSAPVNLPHGAVVTSVVVYGNAGATAETWALGRSAHDSEALFQAMAGANIDTADSTISYATIDNSAYSYVLYTSDIDTGDAIYGGKITYTLS